MGSRHRLDREEFRIETEVGGTKAEDWRENRYGPQGFNLQPSVFNLILLFFERTVT